MIPKTIHYCWFGGGDKPKLAQKCIESWHQYGPDYQIIEWNEGNFDVTRHPYLKWCYEQRKWAFLSDYARLLILLDQGGVYLDTDVELVKPLDDLLKYNAYFGFERDLYIATGLGFGCITGHPAVKVMAEVYEGLKPNSDGSFTPKPCPYGNTDALLPYGLIPNGQRQTVLEAEILPVEYLDPFDNPTGILDKTENTYSIHWYAKSWMSKKVQIKSRLMRPLHRIFGTHFILFRIMRKKK